MNFEIPAEFASSMSIDNEENIKFTMKIEELLRALEEGEIDTPSTHQILIEILNTLENMIDKNIPFNNKNLISILPIINLFINNKDLLCQVSYPKIACYLLSKAAEIDLGQNVEKGQHELLQYIQNACWLCSDLSKAIPWETSSNLCIHLVNSVLNLTIVADLGKITIQLLESIPQKFIQNSDILLKAKIYLYHCNSPKEAITLLNECLLHQSMKSGHFSEIDNTIFEMHNVLAYAYAANGQIDEGKNVYYRLAVNFKEYAHQSLLFFLPATGENWVYEAIKNYQILTSKKDSTNTVDNIILLLDLAQFYAQYEQIHVCEHLLKNVIAKICAKCDAQDLLTIANKCASGDQFPVPFCMTFAAILLKEDQKNNALIFLQEFSDNTSVAVQYLLARAHLEVGNLDEGSKIAQSLERSVDTVSLVCCSHILHLDFESAVQNFELANNLTDYGPSTNQFTRTDMNSLTQTLIVILKEIAETGHPLLLLNKLLPFLVSIPQNCLEVRAIIKMIGLIFLQSNPVLAPQTFILTENFDVNPSLIFNKTLEFIAYAFLNQNLFSMEDHSKLYGSFFSYCLSDPQHDSHLHYLLGGYHLLTENFLGASKAFSIALEVDTQVGMHNLLTNVGQRGIARAINGLFSLLQREENIESIEFKEQIKKIADLMKQASELGPWERLLLLKSIDILIAKKEINSDWWNSNKLIFLENPDAVIQQEMFKDFMSKILG